MLHFNLSELAKIRYQGPCRLKVLAVHDSLFTNLERQLPTPSPQVGFIFIVWANMIQFPSMRPVKRLSSGIGEAVLLRGITGMLAQLGPCRLFPVFGR